MGRPGRTCITLELPKLCAACLQPQRKQKCAFISGNPPPDFNPLQKQGCPSFSSGGRDNDDECNRNALGELEGRPTTSDSGTASTSQGEGGRQRNDGSSPDLVHREQAHMQAVAFHAQALQRSWKPAETGRPASTCARLGLLQKCSACNNPQRKRKCCYLMWGELLDDSADRQPIRQDHDDEYFSTSAKLTAYRAEDWRTDKHRLPDVAERKKVQLQRTAELAAQREEQYSRIREEAYNEAIQLTDHQHHELEGIVSSLKVKLADQAEDLIKVKRDRGALMAAKRQRALSSWFCRSDSDRPEMQLPTRKSHFDVQADIAQGYSKSELQRTFRSHVERIEHFIESLVDDPIKQLQLADAVSRRFGGVKSSLPIEDEASTYVLESLRNFEATLRMRYKGRYPNEIRAAHQAVSSAITSKVPRNKLSVVAQATGFCVDALADGRRRWALWFDGTEQHMIEFRGQVRSDRMDEAWIDFAVTVWETETRPDPATKCSIRNPHNRSDKKLYRIHYLDMRIGDMHQLILQKGREKFHDADPPFHFSWWYCIKVSVTAVTHAPIHWFMMVHQCTMYL